MKSSADRITYEDALAFARQMDVQDPLSAFRQQFHLPRNAQGQPLIYLCGNSLGLQPKNVRDYVEQELMDWERLGVEGHVHARRPWMPYHEFLTESMAKLVGAKPSEVVVMNSLTVNLHLMMISFYRPAGMRRKVLMEYCPFPSDRYAVHSQIRMHGYDPESCLIELMPEPGTEYVDPRQIEQYIREHGEEIALVLIGNVNYYTGQAYPMASIVRWAHAQGCQVGFDLAHGAGNLLMNLHEIGPDFAVWCSYKYLNAGPGGLSGCFVHERHEKAFDLHRLAGWWGHDKTVRFKMERTYSVMPGAEGWQLSNPPILPMAALKASLDIFDAAGMPALRQKSLRLTGYLAFLLKHADTNVFRLITPMNKAERGCQLSIQVRGGDKWLFERVTAAGVIADWREPDVIRVAPVPLYNTYEEVWRFAHILREAVNT